MKLERKNNNIYINGCRFEGESKWFKSRVLLSVLASRLARGPMRN